MWIGRASVATTNEFMASLDILPDDLLFPESYPMLGGLETNLTVEVVF